MIWIDRHKGIERIESFRRLLRYPAFRPQALRDEALLALSSLRDLFRGNIGKLRSGSQFLQFKSDTFDVEGGPDGFGMASPGASY